MDIESKTISAVIPDEHTLELTINKLLAEAVSRSDISVQGAPEQIHKKYGVSYINPEVVESSKNPPTKEPFLNDDWGWVIGFSFAIPFVVCIIIGIFIIGDVQSSTDNILYGFLGALIGSILGFLCLTFLKNRHYNNARLQEAKGGFVIWVTTHTAEQHHQVEHILEVKNI